MRIRAEAKRIQQSCSPTARREVYNKSSDIFLSHLKEDTPICLPMEVRLAVAAEARDCLFCRGCHRVSTIVPCERVEGEVLHGAMKKERHCCSNDVPFEVFDDPNWETIQQIVHTTVNHQARVDGQGEWYRKALILLDRTSLIPKSFTGEKREDLLATLFVEVVATTLSSHLLHTMFIVLGETPPKLPSGNNVSVVPPSFQDVVSSGLLKPGRKLRRSPKESKPPRVACTESDAYMSIDEKHYEIIDCINSMHAMGWLLVAPLSLSAFLRLHEHVSLSGDEITKPWKKLDPSKYCTDGFSRQDYDTIRLSVAEQYKTEF